MVAADLETPGIIATDCIRPIQKALCSILFQYYCCRCLLVFGQRFFQR